MRLPGFQLIATILLLLWCSLATYGASETVAPQKTDVLDDCSGTQGDKLVLCLEQIKIKHPESTEPYAILAHHYATQGDQVRAIEQVDRALLIDPDDIGLHIFRAQLLKSDGDMDAANVESQRIRELKMIRIDRLLYDPVDDVSELRIAAHLADVAGDSETAVRLYERYFEYTENPDAHNLSRYAKVLARLDRFDSALVTMEDAFAAVDDGDVNKHVELLDLRAQIKEWSGDLEGAEEDRKELNAIREHIRGSQNEGVSTEL